MIRTIKQRRSLSILLLVCAAGMFLTASAAYSETLKKEVKKKYILEGEVRLVVKNAKGQTIVVGKDGLDAIHILATQIVITKSEEKARELMDRLTFEIESEGDEVRIISRYPDRHKEEKSIWSFFKGLKHRTAIDYMIEVPAEFAVGVYSTSGDVEVSSIEGDAKIKGTSGDVRVREIGGSCLIELTSGDVEIEDIKGETRVELTSGSAFVDGSGEGLILSATSGDVEVFNIGGDADVKLVSGDLLIDGCRGDLVSASSSGDVVIKEIGGSANVEASSGSIEIFLVVDGEKKYNLNTCSGDVNVFYKSPRDIGFFLDINTMSGTIDGNMEIKLEKVSRRHLKGIVGKGRGSIVIATSSGDITIHRRNGE